MPDSRYQGGSLHSVLFAAAAEFPFYAILVNIVCMNRVAKVRLFLHVGGGVLSFAVTVFAAIFLPAVIYDHDSAKSLLYISPFFFSGAIWIVWLKTRRGLMAEATGERLEAVVSGIEEHSDDSGGGTVTYVLTWADTKGFLGFSLPREDPTFDGLKPGGRITVYKNNDHDSWWERNLPGET